MFMVECEELVKIYKVADIEVMALQGLDLYVEKGELMAIIGNSGSGKSTLLNILGGLDRPTAGKLIVDGKNLLKMSEKELVRYKRETVGFVWQNNARNLIPYLSALENVELPMIFKGKIRRQRAKELLEIVGLGNKANRKPAELSGGEQQRVAIAIALANDPKLLLADEPTGSLDTKMANVVLDVIRELNRQFQLTTIIVTHDMRLARKVDRVVAIRDGKTSSEFIRKVSSSDVKTFVEEEMEARMNELSHQELAIVDRAGRIQIPRDYLEALGISNRLQVKLEKGRIVLLPPELGEEKKRDDC
ncbi:ABC-type lipoprotein export system, ATPase component [Caldanaerobius fijiensis DSM 17918]|uniref:ABC-type lipoprotein export system, ATPase component n=2 Tax=Caldanaerobius TaxID=862261 RepID=A0A1M5C251_9THEO|nr:ABC transporter ATP-binding protein [Caldanaerobius fijiensis]SHF48740.1 ABC-type lipoprotein export system, ATPase component [Caldanaerobius fijiensis DSM 17918]